MRNFVTLTLTISGVIMIVVSGWLIYPRSAMATCTVNLTCPLGGQMTCTGDKCKATETCIECKVGKIVQLGSGCCPNE